MERKSAAQWLAEYSRTHLHPTNKLIHYVCVPAILWSAVALLWALPRPRIAAFLPELNWAIALVALALAFYASLGWRWLAMMSPIGAGALALTAMANAAGWPLAQIAVAVFAVAWVGQFVGHAIEGKRPSFFDDLRYLLIGPLWIQNRIASRVSKFKPRRAAMADVKKNRICL